MRPAQTTNDKQQGSLQEQRILDEIEQLQRELEARQSAQQPVPSCIVRAYHELIDRQYRRLDRIDEQPTQRSINVP